LYRASPWLPTGETPLEHMYDACCSL